ncbi:disintegrin and metalloproteinase domain-containing protein 10-like [Watersipora subatra]|uniref:disintegrin and metalloproteinase domain-containing protein 10-like n=1 Tax=Watersipora subatra TaxID=2589382 RepID=UPI00355C1005
MAKILIFTFLLLLNFIGATDCLRLSEHIGHYETLEYDQSLLRERHTRSRRSVYDKVMKVNITAFGSELSLLLHPDTETFHSHTIIEMNGVEEKLDTSHLYQGVVEGYPGSRVVGAITDGIFQGRIVLNDGERYHVERKEHYHKDNKDLAANARAHSVIYHDDSVDLEGFYKGLREKRKASDSTCGNSDSGTVKWMDQVKRSAEEGEGGYQHRAGDNPYIRAKRMLSSYSREKRNTRKTTCNLFLQGDPELWKYYDDMYSSAATEEQIREEISALFHSHVQEVHSIYTKTTFRVSGDTQSFTNHGFRVTRVLMNKTCESGDYGSNPFCSPNIDSSNLLNLNSYRNHDAYCLAYVFTYRDFDGGTLGLAWVAEPGKVGGICSQYQFVRDSGFRSLNTGIITLNNYRKRVPPRVSHLTFAHELGHNFGSPHDVEGHNPSCTPESDGTSSDGNYIMFASATTGTKPDNDQFSQCSKTAIAQVLNTVINNMNGKQNCFEESTGAWCGNQIQEKAEVCDCGYETDCPLNDLDCCKCCVGQSDDNQGPNACKLRTARGVVCDPSQGPCCNANCGFVQNNILCRPESECLEAQNCSSNQAKCPNSTHKPDRTPCSLNTQICKAGECTGSLCELITSDGIAWSACEPDRTQDTKANDDPRLCFLACQKNSQSVCWSSADLEATDFPNDFKNILIEHNKGSSIAMAAGFICDKEKGFCDHFQKCRLINAKGPLARLKDLIFSESTLDLIKNWVTVYWYAVVLSGLGFIGLMVLFVKCCAVHTPSSNPKKPPARRISQTLTLRRRQQAQAARSSNVNQRLQQQQPPKSPSRDPELPPRYSDLISSETEQGQLGNQRPNPRHGRPHTNDKRQQQYEMRQQRGASGYK